MYMYIYAHYGNFLSSLIATQSVVFVCFWLKSVVLQTQLSCAVATFKFAAEIHRIFCGFSTELSLRIEENGGFPKSGLLFWGPHNQD